MLQDDEEIALGVSMFCSLIQKRSEELDKKQLMAELCDMHEEGEQLLIVCQKVIKHFDELKTGLNHVLEADAPSLAPRQFIESILEDVEEAEEFVKREHVLPAMMSLPIIGLSNALLSKNQP